MRKTTFILMPLVVLAFSILLASNATAQIDVRSAVALSQKLNEMRWFELSHYLLDKEIKAYPDEKDVLLVQKAQTLFAQNKVKEAEAIINSIPPGSQGFLTSRLILGMSAFKKGKFDMASETLKNYLDTVLKKLPHPDEKARVKDYQTAIAYLKASYVQLGKMDEASKTADYITAIQDFWRKLQEKAGNKNSQLSPQDKKCEDTIMKAQMALDAAEQMKKMGKTGWKTKVSGHIKALNDVYWSGKASPYSARAAVQQGRGYYILGRYEDGFKKIREFMAAIRGLDDWYKKNNQIYAAPAADAYLWLGFCAKGMGDQETDEAKKKTQYNLAAKCFIKIFKDYEPKKCPAAGKAVVGFNEVKDALVKLGEREPQLPAGVEVPDAQLDRTKADNLFSQDKYKEAIPLYLDLIRTKGVRTSPQAPGLLYRLTYSYVKTNSYLEAMATVRYLGECFPNNQEITPNALLLVGEALWKKYKQAVNPKEKEAMLKDALSVYDMFLKTCPTHELADEIAFRIAQVRYIKATDLAMKVNEMPSGPDKLKKSEEARQAYEKAIPAYQYIVDNFLHTDVGKKSAFYLACCYTNSRQYIKGAEIFLRFAEAETNREDKSKRDMGMVADAKMRAADNYLRYATALEKESKKLKVDAEKAPSGNADEKAATPDAKKDKNAPKTAEALLAEAEAKQAKAKEYFLLAVKQAQEFLEWLKPGNRLADATGAKAKAKIKKATARAYGLIPWAYDGAGDIDHAITAFTQFIQKQPDAKGIPSAMARLGMLYIEKGKPNEAAQVFNTLTSKFPDEGKKVLPKMARTMYDLGKYDKALDAIKRIFAKQPVDISVGDLKWIAKNMSDCGGTHPKEGAALALKACALLQKKLAEPKWKEWLGKKKAKEIASDPEKQKKWLKVLKEQLLFFTGNAAFWAGDYAKAAESLGILLANDLTPYFYDAHFLRASALRKLGQAQRALDEDYSAISATILGDKKAPLALRYKSQCCTGDAYVDLKEYGKASTAYSMVAMVVMQMDNPNSEEAKKLKSDKDALEWVEYALFMLASCQKANGKKADMEKTVELYKNIFRSTGKLRGKIGNPPPPNVAIKEAPAI